MAKQAFDVELTGLTETEPPPFEPVQAFQGALARISVLHNEEVAALQSQVLELRHRLKRLYAGVDRAGQESALTETVLTSEVAAEITAAAVASCIDGPSADGDGNAPASAHQNGRQASPGKVDMLDMAAEPHPCAKPHRLPPTFWQTAEPASGPGSREPEDSSELEKACPGLGSAARAPSMEESGSQARRSSADSSKSAGTPPPKRSAGLSDSESRDAIAQQVENIKKELEHYTSPAAKRLKTIYDPGKRWLVPDTRVPKWSLLWVVEHHVFDSLCAFIIILNSALVGLSVVWQTTENSKHMLISFGSHFCSAFFFLELCLRMYANGCRRFFLSEGKGWNTFDFMLVVSSLFDIVLSSLTNSQAQVDILNTGMKTIKIMRIVRVFRVFRFFKELSLLALMIVDSMKSLGWAIVMVMIVVYVFAILFTDNAVEYIKVVGNDPFHTHYHLLPELQKWFGTLTITTYTLVQATLGGVSWGVVSDVLIDYDKPMAFLFLFYQAFTILAVLNIITGVFVDNAVETAQTQREFLVQKEMELKEKYIGEMKHLFEEMDADGNGTVTMEEIQEYLKDTRIMSYFQALGLDPHDTERLFRLIDDDQSGGLSVDEFLAGCLRLKGQARSIDIHALLHDLKKLFARFERMESMVVGRTSCANLQEPAAPGEAAQDYQVGRADRKVDELLGSSTARVSGRT